MPIDTERAARLSTDVVTTMKALTSMRHVMPPLRPGLEIGVYPVLFTLREAPARISVIADRVQSDISTVSRQVSHLQGMGLVSKVTDPDDGRAQRVQLTDEGVELLATVLDGRVRWFQHMLADWSDEDVDQLSDLLSRFRSALLEQREEAIAAPEQLRALMYPALEPAPSS